jgi:hypothetical protein
MLICVDIKKFSIYRMEKIIVPATPETATSTLPWPPGPRMNSLSVLVFDPPNDKMLLSLDCPANDVQQE